MLSRVADSQYWMSRYLARAEHTARLIDVNLNLMLDQAPTTVGSRWLRLQASLLPAPRDPSGSDASGKARAISFELLTNATFEACLAAARENTKAIVACLAASRENARQVRETISSDMWEQLNRLYLHVSRWSPDELWNSAPHEFFRAVIEGAQLFEGVTDGTTCHDEGWHFIRLGRAIERAAATAALLDVHFGDGMDRHVGSLAADQDLEWIGVLKSCTAFEAFCKVHTAELRPQRIVEFLLLEPLFPHSVRFNVDVVRESLTAISEDTGRKNDRAERLAGRLGSALRFGQTDEILAAGLHPYLVDVQDQCAKIQTAIHEAYIDYPLEAALDSQ
jgi:uncharacterized alpha-E superfamily protein